MFIYRVIFHEGTSVNTTNLMQSNRK